MLWINASSSVRFEKDYLKILRLLGRHKRCCIMAEQLPISQAMDSVISTVYDENPARCILIVGPRRYKDAFFGSSARSAAETDKMPAMVRYVLKSTRGLVLLLTSRSGRVAEFAGRSQIHVSHLGLHDSRRLLLNGNVDGQMMPDDRIQELL